MKTKSKILLGLALLALGACSSQSLKEEKIVNKSNHNIEVVHEISNTRPGNLTITPNNRMILSEQPLDNPTLRVVEVMKDGSLKPFPTLDWADGPDKGKVGFASVIGVHTTTDGIVWILDMGNPTTPAKLVAWDSVKDTLVNVINIDKSAIVSNSFLQDFAIDEKRNKIYIADTTLGNIMGDIKSAFVVVDLKTGKSRRVLEGDNKLMPPMKKVVIKNKTLSTKVDENTNRDVFLGLNPISIDPKNEWVYFGTVNGTEIFRILSADLSNENLTNKELSNKIELYGKKNPSDGFIVDEKGNVYSGDIVNSSITVTNKDEHKVLVQNDKLLAWPDGFAIHDGYLYVTQNQLNLTSLLNNGKDEGTKPYHILKIKLDK